ncbi:MAG: HAD hydrolase family protein [Planctomycetota bacterium]|jgi:Cof subfamily protein (haloacid dehalogenase superfamily)
MKYRLLGVDVDGTLLESDHRPSAETIEALRAARSEDLCVCLATGRSHAETADVWVELGFTPPYEPIVLVGGAMVSEPDTGRTLYQRTIERELACEFADALGEAGHCAMGLVDAWRYGWDYVLCETGDVHAAYSDWLDKTQARVRRVRSLRDAPDIPNPLRINTVADPPAAEKLARQLQRRFDGRLNVHAIVAPNYEVTIVEAFACGVDKWNALKYVAQGYRIVPREIVAIGDDINDLSMIRAAALGAAMPNAPSAVRDAADHIAVDGLAAFIRQLIAGELE